MDPGKIIELQRQVKENNAELGDFLDDLKDWKLSVDSKYCKLNSSQEKTEMAPIRNSLYKKKRRKKVKKTEEGKIPVKKSVRIKSNDYNSWDKLDVDKMLQEIDEKENDVTDSSTDDEWEDLRRIKIADQEKESGNLAFKKQDFVSSIESYTNAIQLTPENPILYTNRAMAHLKLDQFAAAESDCSIALQLNPNHTKALFRRSTARKKLGRVTEAVEDLVRLLELEPNNTETLKELQVLNPSRLPTKKPVFKKDRVWKRIEISEVSLESEPLIKTLETRKIASIIKKKLPIPNNFYQFERDLRELSESNLVEVNQEVIEYICRIPPQSYVRIFNNNLTTQYLSYLLKSFEKSDLEPDAIVDRLKFIKEILRFDLAWMLASENDILYVRKIIENIASNSLKDELKTAYSM